MSALPRTRPTYCTATKEREGPKVEVIPTRGVAKRRLCDTSRMALLSHIPYSVLQTIRAAEGTHARSSRENCSASRRVEGSCAVRSRIDAGADPLSPGAECDCGERHSPNRMGRIICR